MIRKNKPQRKIISNSELMKEWDFEKNSELGFDPHVLSYYSKVKAYWICPNCGLSWNCSIGNRSKENGQQCPGDCNKEKRKEIRIKSIEKSKKTNLEKYGVENPFQSEIFKKKSKKTCLDKYGVENPKKSNEIQNRIKQNCIDKHGVDHPNKVPEIKDRAIQTCINRYGVRSPSQFPEFKEKKIQTSLKNCGKPYHLCKENHEKGDRSEYYKKYKGGFTKALKKQIKERDKNICQNIGCNSKKNICVHHIDNIKSNNDPLNLITLCHSCHSKVTILFPFNPDFYIAFFRNIIDEKYVQKHS